MTESITLDGVTFSTDDFIDYGYLEAVTVNSVSYERFIALWAAGIRQIGKEQSSTSTSSVAIGTGSKTFVLATDVNAAVGSWWILAETAAPTTNYMIGQVTSYTPGTKTLIMTVASGDETGSGTIAAWTASLTGKRGNAGATGSAGANGTDGALNLTIASRSSNTILGTGDDGKTIVATASFTQTLTAAATLTSGWAVVIKNASTGDLTIDPNSTETIDGRTTLVLRPQEAVILECDGSNFHIIAKHETVGFLTAKSETPVNGDIDIMPYAPFAGEVLQNGGKTSTGTLSTTPKINGVAITGGATSITSSFASTARSASNTFARGDALTETLASVSSAQNYTAEWQIRVY